MAGVCGILFLSIIYFVLFREEDQLISLLNELKFLTNLIATLRNVSLAAKSRKFTIEFIVV